VSSNEDDTAKEKTEKGCEKEEKSFAAKECPPKDEMELQADGIENSGEWLNYSEKKEKVILPLERNP